MIETIKNYSDGNFQGWGLDQPYEEARSPLHGEAYARFPLSSYGGGLAKA